MNAGRLSVRLVFGLLFAVHGSQKLFGAFGGVGLSGTGAFLESLGFRPGRLFALTDGMAEFAGGLLLALGLLSPVAAAAIVSGMLVAIVTVHWGNGLLTLTNGVELPLMYIAVAVLVAVSGPGTYSLDAAAGLTDWWTPGRTGLVVALGAGGGLASVATRRLPRGETRGASHA